ncbi:unnamed protein product [Eruca vesicaria subsp. sativa]|uniref:Uncharacterized protein n=1 Tax=Eruca vesicaria subsp. sativa TaxID=29727 RepID=A0ABC8KEJ7_ERUVS|nr:unnamed protein product [Eruca vesicaria subsp. sativa]
MSKYAFTKSETVILSVSGGLLRFWTKPMDTSTVIGLFVPPVEQPPWLLLSTHLFISIRFPPSPVHIDFVTLSSIPSYQLRFDGESVYIEATIMQATINASHVEAFRPKLAAGNMYSLSGFDVGHVVQIFG